jgi:hypothetical protein
VKGRPAGKGQEQAEAETGPDTPSSSPAPDPEPPIDDEGATDYEAMIPKNARDKVKRIKELGATPVMGHEKKMLAEIPVNAPWFKWALDGGSPAWSPEFRAIFSEYVQLAHPDLWQAQREAAGEQMEIR